MQSINFVIDYKSEPKCAFGKAENSLCIQM